MIKIMLFTILLYPDWHWTRTEVLEDNLKTCQLHAAQINILPPQAPAIMSESWCESVPVQ